MTITTTDVEGFDFGSNLGAGTTFRAVASDVADVPVALALAGEGSTTKALRLARGILTTTTDVDSAFAEMGAMVDWAAERTEADRATVARAARLSDGGVLFVDRVSRLPLAQAKPMMQSYFDTGGEAGDVIEWLGIVGHALREADAPAARRRGDMGPIVDAIGDAIEAVAEAVETIVDAVIDGVEALAEALADVVNWTIDQLADLGAALLEAGRTIGEIIAAAAGQAVSLVRRMAEALLDLGEALVDVLEAVADAAVSAVRFVVAAAIRAGELIVDVLAWMASAALDVLRAAVRGLIDAAGSLLRLIVDIAQLGLAAMRELVRGLLEIGETLVGLVVRFAELALDALEVLLEAVIEAGLTVAELVGELIVLAYDTVTNVVKAALRVGITVLELVGDVVAESYFAFRRIINGIIEATGPVGDILDAILDSVEDFVGDAWRSTLNALRYAEASLSEALDWARAKGVEVLAEVLQAWEDIGESLIDAYRWARDVAVATGDAVFRLVGEATFRLRNSVSYVIGYLENDFLPGVEDFVTGLLDAGYAIADLVVRVVERSVEVVGAAFRAALATGATLAELLVLVVTEPDNAMENVLAALDEMGQTLENVIEAIDAAGDALAEDTMRAMRAIGTTAERMVAAIFQVGGGVIGVALSALLATVATYRPLNGHERTIGRRIFGDSLDYDDIFVSQDDWVNELVFWVQDGFGEDPESRAFVTGNLINFDVDDILTDSTLIHELTHVWQNAIEGPFYLAEAVHAQLDEELGGPDAYNYGYTNESNGDGAEAALAAASFDDFNPEQQGNIIEHYHVRRYETDPPSDVTAWQPYVDHVRAA